MSEYLQFHGGAVCLVTASDLVEAEAIVATVQTDDCMEGVTSFIEKRKPASNGK